MNKKEFSIFAMALKTYYPRENLLPNEQAMELWFKQLEDIPFQVAEVGLNKWVSLNKWSPSIADIREIASETISGQITDWGDGWEQVLRAIRQYGSYNASAALDSMDSITRKCVERLGFREICMSENISVERANFRMLYEQIANRQKEDSKLSLSIKTKLAQLSDHQDKKMIE